MDALDIDVNLKKTSRHGDVYEDFAALGGCRIWD